MDICLLQVPNALITGTGLGRHDIPSRSVRTTTPRTFQQRQNRMGKNTPVSPCPVSDGFVSNTPLVSSSSGEGGPKDPPPLPFASAGWHGSVAFSTS